MAAQYAQGGSDGPAVRKSFGGRDEPTARRLEPLGTQQPRLLQPPNIHRIDDAEFTEVKEPISDYTDTSSAIAAREGSKLKYLKWLGWIFGSLFVLLLSITWLGDNPSNTSSNTANDDAGKSTTGDPTQFDARQLNDNICSSREVAEAVAQAFLIQTTEGMSPLERGFARAVSIVSVTNPTFRGWLYGKKHSGVTQVDCSSSITIDNAHTVNGGTTQGDDLHYTIRFKKEVTPEDWIAGGVGYRIKIDNANAVSNEAKPISDNDGLQNDRNGGKSDFEIYQQRAKTIPIIADMVSKGLITEDQSKAPAQAQDASSAHPVPENTLSQYLDEKAAGTLTGADNIKACNNIVPSIQHISDKLQILEIDNVSPWISFDGSISCRGTAFTSAGKGVITYSVERLNSGRIYLKIDDIKSE